MTASLLSGLRSVELRVADVAACEKFYVETWHLAVAARQGGAVYLRGTGAAHHIVALHPGAGPTELLSVTFNAQARADVDALAKKLAAANVRIAQAPGPIDEPGGGYGLTLVDPEGRRVRVVAGDAKHADATVAKDRPERLSHVVFNAPDQAAAARFYTDVLGFRLSDWTRIMHFVRCDTDHHNIAFAVGPRATLNHIAFLMPDLDSVMRGGGRLRDAGFPIEWGVGRHGPGNNVFCYFIAPGEVVVEYTSEVEKVGDDYVTNGPDYWKWPPGRIDHWGVSAPPTDRLKKAQDSVVFAA